MKNLSKTFVKKNILLASLVSALALTGCNSEESTMNDVDLQETIKKNNWKLKDAKDASNNNIIELANINKKNTWLTFTDVNAKKISFTIGCNAYAGQYNLSEKNELTTNSTLTTKKYCKDLDLAEKKLAELLNQKNKLSLSKQGVNSIITMTMADGSQLVWEPRIIPKTVTKNTEILSNLRKYNWVMQSASQTPENPNLSSVVNIPELEKIKDKVKLSINGNNLAYSTGCYQTGASFNLSNKNILKLDNFVTKGNCQSTTESADNILSQVMQQNTKISMVQGEELSFTQTTYRPNERAKFITWKAVDKSNLDLKMLIDQFNWKLTNAVKQNSPADSVLTTIPELIAVKDKVTLGFKFTRVEMSNYNDTISYSAGCNNYSGKFEIDQTKALEVKDVQMTEKACADATANAETLLNKIMKKGGKLALTMDNNVPTLTFTTGNANDAMETLTWQGSAR